MELFRQLAAKVIEKRGLDRLLGLYFSMRDADKFTTLESLVLSNNFLDNETRACLVEIFIKTQRTYHGLGRLRALYQWKKARLCPTETDLCMNPMDSFPESQKVTLLQNGARYCFRLTDLLNMWNTALTKSQSLLPSPSIPSNPYTGVPFRKSHLYAIYFKLRWSTLSVSVYVQKFFELNFNLRKFRYQAYPILKELAIDNYMADSDTDTLFYDLIHMVESMNHLLSKRHISQDLPSEDRESLVRVFKPILHTYFRGRDSCNPLKKKHYKSLTKASLRRFIARYPMFGRRRVKARRDSDSEGSTGSMPSLESGSTGSMPGLESLAIVEGNLPSSEDGMSRVQPIDLTGSDSDTIDEDESDSIHSTS